MTGLSQRKKETATNELLFGYDRWNLIATLNAQLPTRNTFVWDLDLSGSQQGAGLPRYSEATARGVLVVNFRLSTFSLQPSTSFVSFDGNGNVAALFGSSGESAWHEYGPFGEVIRATGSVAKTNPLRCSPKYLGAQGCGGMPRIAEVCLRCEANYTQRWCLNSNDDPGCWSGCYMVRAKFLTRSYDYVFCQTQPCSSGDAN